MTLMKEMNNKIKSLQLPDTDLMKIVYRVITF